MDEKIVVEYDGSGHNLSVKLGTVTKSEFIRKEIYRNKVLFRNDYRLIRIISSKDKLLTDDEFLKLLTLAKEYFSTGRHWVEINIDEYNWKCSQYIIHLNEILNN